MELYAAFLLGLLGSLHCAGMCGPLVLALPFPAGGPASFALSRCVYHLGRVTAYAALGGVAGGLGHALAISGFQRWTSLAAGLALLLGLVASRKMAMPVWSAVGWIKAQFGVLIKRRTYPVMFLLGVLNGLLPCGLVYVAAAAAFASGTLLGGIGSMLAFGLGTAPVMFGISLAGRKLLQALPFAPRHLATVSIALIAALLIIRGLALGVPYLSPEISVAPPACH